MSKTKPVEKDYFPFWFILFIITCIVCSPLVFLCLPLAFFWFLIYLISCDDEMEKKKRENEKKKREKEHKKEYKKEKEEWMLLSDEELR